MGRKIKAKKGEVPFPYFCDKRRDREQGRERFCSPFRPVTCTLVKRK